MVTHNNESEGQNIYTCPNDGTFPTLAELRSGLGDYAMALHICVILVLIVNSILFIILAIKFFKTVPQSQVKNILKIYFDMS